MPSYLVDGVRSPIGRFRRSLAALGPVELATGPATALRERFGADAVDRCVMGNVLPAGHGQNVARQIVVVAGFAPTAYSLSLNDVCLSSMTSVALAAEHLASRPGEAWLVGGADSMSQADVSLGGRQPTLVFSDGLTCALESQVHGAVADVDDRRLDVSRADDDAVALASFERADAARQRGYFADEIVPVVTPDGTVFADEGVRTTSAAALAGLAPVFSEDGTVTAGNASQMSDGASVGIVAGSDWVARRRVAPLARIGGSAHVASADGSLHERPAEAVERLLGEHDLCAADIDLWEINEAFAGVVIASQRLLCVNLADVNVNGGAIAIGHPLAASGFRLVLTLARAMRERDARRGVAAMCGGGGQGAAILLEAVEAA
ncbi:acetyl-CoA C-acetyltransferase [soil metagenome]